MNGTAPAMPGVSGGKLKVDAVEEVSLLDEHQQLAEDRPAGVPRHARHGRGAVGQSLAGGIELERTLVVGDGDANLLEVVQALSTGEPPRGPPARPAIRVRSERR